MSKSKCQSLNAHLRGYFITTRLLKLPKREFLNLITPVEISTKRGKLSSPLKCKSRIGGDGNRRDLEGESGNLGGSKLLYSTICVRCENIVNEAVDLHLKMVELQRRIDKLGEALFEIREIGNQESKGKRGTTVNKMLDLSLACLGKTPFPERKKPKKSTSPRKLRNRPLRPATFEDEDEAIAFPIDNYDKNDASASHSKTKEEDVPQIKEEVEERIEDLNNYGDDFIGPEDHPRVDGSIPEQFPRDPPHIQESFNLEDNSDARLEAADDPIDDLPDFPGGDSDSDYQPEGDKSDSDEDEVDDDDSDADYDPRVERTKKSLEEAPLQDSNSEDVESENDNLEAPADPNPAGANQLTTDHLTSRQSALPAGILADFTCKDCHKIFSNKTSLRAHTLKIHGYDMLLYTCPRCPNLQFSRKLEMVKHRNEVHGHVCELCGKRLNRLNALRTHYELVHKQKYTFSCHVCKKMFKRRSQLKTHRLKEHTVRQDILKKLPSREPQNPEEEEWSKIPCWYCGKRYLSWEHFDNHLQTYHESNNRKKLKRRKNQPLLEPERGPRRKCFFCWRNFSLEQRLLIHVKNSHPENIANLLELQLPCELCTEDKPKFTTCQALQDHLQTEHKAGTIFTCEKCGLPFLEEQSLQTHLTIHKHFAPPEKLMIKETFEFKCWFCWEVFPNPDALQSHLSRSTRHRKKKIDFPCDLEGCDHHLNTPFSNVTDLNNHLASFHGGEIHHCDWCSWGFLSKDMLTIHKLNHVQRIKEQFKCPACDHLSCKLPALKNHYNSFHDLNLNLHFCPHCHMGFKSAHAINSHLKSEHENVKVDISSMFQCDQCVKSFSNINSLKVHELNVHRDEYCCSECGQKFKNNVTLQRHRKRDHGHGKRFLCSECGKEFLQRSELRKHMTHHGEANLECSICHYRFKHIGNLRQHMIRLHNPDKKKGPPPKFQCPKCEKGFARKDTLDDHFRVEHTNETWRVWTCENCGKRFTRSCYLKDHLATSGKACEAWFETLKRKPDASKMDQEERM